MLELVGKYASAKVFTDNIEPEAVGQILMLLNMPYVQGAEPRFMPDVHAGKGCTIGTTMKVRDKICPNLVGVDIGCGMLAVEIGESVTDLARFDQCVRQTIPAGFDAHTGCTPKMEAALADADVSALRCMPALQKSDKLEHIRNSVATLGGGNHYVEIDAYDDTAKLLVIHSGSRYLGKFVAEYYQALAVQQVRQGTAAESIPEDLCYVEGDTMADYLHDVAICQRYAAHSRRLMAENVLTAYLGESVCVTGVPGSGNPGHAQQFHGWETIHNYIDMEDMVLRKGAIACRKGQKVLIPLNMRDGALVCMGLGNLDWNMSGPHGAGRAMSRSQAKAQIGMDEYESAMAGIWSSTVNRSTLDEAPQAYKPAAEIIENIRPTADIVATVKPVYNFKAAERAKRKADSP